MLGIKYKTSFRDIWLTDNQYELWLQNNAGIYSAKCKVCPKSFSVAGQGRKALDTHAAKGLKHQQRLPNHNSSLKTASAAGQTENRPSGSSKQTSILSLTENEAEKKAEIMWAPEVVIAKHSFCSCDNKSELFNSMFPDSQVAKIFAYGKTKCKYLVRHGIAPYFKEVLTKSLMELEHYVCLFDESYSNIVKKGQMDMHI